MKAVIRNVSRTLFIATSIILAATVADAQLKIGDNPTQIKKSAILDLESGKQGLLLPRLTSFTAIDAAIGADVVDGMIVYLNSGVAATDGVYMRKNNAWVKIASAADAVSNWSLLGNTGTTAANYIGTADAQPLSLRTNAVEGMNISTAGAVSFPRVVDLANPALMDVVVISATGVISKRTVPATAFKSLYTSVFTSADSAYTNLNITQNAGGDITINAPILAASNPVGTKYGLLTKADWDKLQALSTGNNFTIANFITAVAAGDEQKGGRITYNAATASYNLELVAASTTLAGIVTTTTQTFGGDKTFANNVAVTGAAAIGGTLGVTGATTLNSTLGVTGATNLGNTLNVTGATTLGNTVNVTGAATLNSTLSVAGKVTVATVDPTATAASYDVLVKNPTTNEIEKKAFNLDALTNAVQFITTGTGAGADSTAGKSVKFAEGTAGTDFNIDADGTTKTVTFNIPDASAVDASHTAVQRGAVSTGAQTFAGDKSFANNVNVGGNTAANSTLQVSGSISMAIANVSTNNYAISATDNTILVNTTASALSVVLPPPTPSITGRIYTIKKVGTGGIDNTLTINCTGVIEGGAAGAGYVIYNDYTFVTLQTDGTAWFIIKK